MANLSDAVEWVVKRISALTRTATNADLTDSEYMAVDKASAYTRKITVASLATWILGRIKGLATSITSFRTGDVIPVDGPSGTAKMSKDDLLHEAAENTAASGLVATPDQVDDKIDALDVTHITYSSPSVGNMSDADAAINTPFFGYCTPIVNLEKIVSVVVNDILTASSDGDDKTCTFEILDSDENVVATSTASVHTLATQRHNYDVKFEFSAPVSVDEGYIRISCPVKISYTDASNASLGEMFDTTRVGKFEDTYGTWSNLTLTQTKQFSIGCEFFALQEVKNNRIDLLSDNAIILYVSTASELVAALDDAKNHATYTKWYNIHVRSGEYNLLPFIDLERITQVTATGYRGIEVPRYTRLIGDKAKRPHIFVDLTETETTTEQQWTVSALNMKNDAELYNLVVTGKQCRFAVHDDGGNASYKRYCENCTFIHYQNTASIIFSQQAAYGNGTYKGCRETFKNCEFIAYHEALYIHDNPNYNVSSDIILDNCRFATGSKPQSVKFQSMGASAQTSILIKDCSFNAPILKKIDDADNDSITIEGWKNTLDTTLGVEVVES